MVFRKISSIPHRDRQTATLDLYVENLEHRVMLAGTVRAIIDPLGNVSLIGDGASNYLEIAREVIDENLDGDTQDIVIRGIPDIRGMPTRLRVGSDLVEKIVVNATDGVLDGNLTVQLRGGNDFVVLRDITVAGNLVLRAGPGHDSVGFFDSTFQGNVQLYTEGGNDFVNLGKSVFQADLDLNTGAGVDYVGLTEVQSAAGTFFKVATGAGADVVYIEKSTFAGNVDIDTGQLIDTLYLAAETSFQGDLRVAMGAGLDLLVVEDNVSFSGSNWSIDGGAGGFGYNNQIFLPASSPWLSSGLPSQITNFTYDFYTISGNATTGFDLPTTLSKWVMDLYYGWQPSVNFTVVDAILAANMARGFSYEDLPRATGPAPNPAQLAEEIDWFLANREFYGYQKLVVRTLFRNETRTFNWSRF